MSVILHCGDCLEYMQGMDDGVIDLTVTSPPYDNLRTYGKDFDAAKFDWRSIIAELYRVTKTGGVVVWVVADATINGSETGTSFRQALWAMECGFNVETMIYQQAGTGAKGSNYYYWQAFEFMFVWAKGQPKTSNRLRDKENKSAGSRRTGGEKTDIIRRTRTSRGDRVVMPKGIRENVWIYDCGKSKGFSQKDYDAEKAHPAVFPESLARDHILSWSNPGDTVLDPMMGSGTTGKMAVMNGRNFIGCDIGADYVEIARRRIEAAQAQPRLLEAAD